MDENQKNLDSEVNQLIREFNTNEDLIAEKLGVDRGIDGTYVVIELDRVFNRLNVLDSGKNELELVKKYILNEEGPNGRMVMELYQKVKEISLPISFYLRPLKEE